MKVLPWKEEYVVIPDQSLSSGLPVVVPIGVAPYGGEAKCTVLSTIL